MSQTHRAWKISILVPLILVSGLFRASAAESTRDRLAALEKALDARIVNWEQSADGSRWEPYKPGRSITAANFRLRATFEAPEFFAAARVAGTPLMLRTRMSARGLAQAAFFLDGREVAQAAVHGESGTAAEETCDARMADRADGARHRLEITVENRGFVPERTAYWPERRHGPPADEGTEFSLISCELVYPAAEKSQAALQEWLHAFQFADILLNPELKRFTFTGKPYDIPDKRRVPRGKLVRLDSALARAVAVLDTRALAAGDWPKVQASLKRSLDLAAPVGDYLREFRIYLVGNAHIDIAWLWRMAETMALSKNTYETVIANMAEYPELTYAQSQAVTYDWIERRHPDLFRAIREKVRSGRWEIVGGMWVEPDCNLISGESWARQLLYGKKYFREKFGVDVRIGWNPDSFGYNWNMPQLYKLSGIDSFITQKLWWNDTTVFPHFLFNWQGVDGSTILTYMPPLSYASELELKEVANGVSKYEATTGLKESLILYGLGDHGGGPNREILDRVRGYGRLALAPRFTHTTPSPFLQKKRSEKLDLPLWKDELYLEYHRGTFTTQGAVKRNTRRTEALLSATEKVSAISSLLGGPYPRRELEKNWKSALTLQFHDILPGSSITPVYRDALETFHSVQKELHGLESGALDRIAGRIAAADPHGPTLVVFNTLSWQRDDIVTLRHAVAAGSAPRLLDESLQEVPCEVGETGEDGRAEISFIARNVPPLGYRSYFLAAVSPPPAAAGGGHPGRGRPGERLPARRDRPGQRQPQEHLLQAPGPRVRCRGQGGQQAVGLRGPARELGRLEHRLHRTRLGAEPGGQGGTRLRRPGEDRLPRRQEFPGPEQGALLPDRGFSLLVLHANHHPLQGPGPPRHPHRGRLVGGPPVAQGLLPGRRQGRQGVLRDPLRRHRAHHPLRHAVGEGALRGAGAALGRPVR
jgi:alpha-mannosidase